MLDSSVIYTLTYAVREISCSLESSLVGPSIHKSSEEATRVLWGFVRHRIVPTMKEEFIEAAMDLGLSEFSNFSEPVIITRPELEVIFSSFSIESIMLSIEWYFNFMNGGSSELDCFYQIKEHSLGGA